MNMSEELLENYGLLEQVDPVAKDWIAGGISGASKEVLREDGKYTAFLPEAEYQGGMYFDTSACVTFSALNCIETIARVRGLIWNKSDRFTAKVSGTTKQGNFLRLVAESIRLQGTVLEEHWPFPRTQRTPVFDWDDYYSDIPAALLLEGLDWLKDWQIQWEWVNVNDLREMLKYGPIQVTVQAWPKDNASGMKENWEGHKYNHAVMLSDVTDEHFEIFDHYDKTTKYLAPGYKFGSAIQFSLIKKSQIPMPTLTLPDNLLVQDSGPGRSGAFGMTLNGKIMVGPTADIMATVLMRSATGPNGEALVKRRPLSAEQWDSFPKVDTKNNPL